MPSSNTTCCYTGQRRNSESEVRKRLMIMIGRRLEQLLFHPQSYGMVQTYNKTINQCFSKLISIFLLAYYSSSQHAFTGHSPSTLLTEKEMKLPVGSNNTDAILSLFLNSESCPPELLFDLFHLGPIEQP